MSQNVHTLHLFFEDPIRLKYCQLVFQYLQSDNPEQAERWAEKLGGADLAKLWTATGSTTACVPKARGWC